MKTALLVEDRDTAFLFLDADNAPAEAVPMTFSLMPGVVFSDVENENSVVWMATDTTIRVFPREDVDFSASFEKEWPIPAGILCLTAGDYETVLARQG